MTGAAQDGAEIAWERPGQAALAALLRRFGGLLPEPLDGRMDLDAYAAKLLDRAEIAVARRHGAEAGLLLLYANDAETRRAHVPAVAVVPAARGSGLGRALMARAMARARRLGMTALDLTVTRDNAPARALYESLGFRTVGGEGARLRLQIELPPLADPAEIPPTPLEPAPELAAAFGLDIDLRLKRDDLYPLPGGGIKARKIRHILRDAIRDERDVIVTNGGPQSNHARATAVMCARLGIACHLVVVLEPGRRYVDTGNHMLVRMSGAAMEYATKETLAAAMDRAVDGYAARGHRPLYVWGGGHGLAGTEAFAEAAAEARAQAGGWRPDVLVLASATGSTQAGLAIGCAGTGTRVIGISVARAAERGAAAVRECVEAWERAHGPAPGAEIDFRDRWTDGGYERHGPEVLETIARAARAGTFFDPTYSGKGWRGLVDLVREGAIPAGSRVLFWHSGGLMNLQASPFARPGIDPRSASSQRSPA